MNVMEHFDGAEQFFSVCEQLKGKRIGIFGHLHPDGDCIGAQVAMRDILMQCGAMPLMGLAEDKFPLNLQWIAQDYDFVRPEEMAADEYIFVDCGIMLRAGDFAKKLPKPLMLIDHHVSGEKFACHNFFYPEAAATCEIIADFLEQKQWTVGAATATALYVGIVTDTGKFSYSSTVARTLFLASQLALWGADPHRIFVEIYENEPREKFALLQRFLASLEFYAEGTICVGRLTEQDFMETGTTANDTEGLVNFPRTIKGVRIAAIAYDREGKTRVSLRSDDPALRLDLFAAKFLGGGHFCAVAFTVNDPYEKFEKNFINALQVHMDSFSGKHP
ncbi:MAG: bifunctional oligoribonuclease/PAP phosphatase NrnA [Puniceicoccales bacterium]|jgi:phosphoesterase RecJ-like protein|nr:bifunctional oligoribonuclease/PAP phosphatase NrnA [Puniceicoccales bacterium]